MGWYDWKTESVLSGALFQTHVWCQLFILCHLWNSSWVLEFTQQFSSKSSSLRNACRATADCSLQTDFKVGSPTGTQTQHQNRHDWRISCWAVGSDYIILYELSQPKTLTAFLAHNIYSVVQLLTFGGAALVEKFLPLCKPEIILIPIKGAGSAVWAWVSVALEKLCQVSDNNPDDVIVSLRQ